MKFRGFRDVLYPSQVKVFALKDGMDFLSNQKYAPTSMYVVTSREGIDGSVWYLPYIKSRPRRTCCFATPSTKMNNFNEVIHEVSMVFSHATGKLSLNS
jgi:hypothetical protein